ncbi:LysE family translocator [Yoonia litorea]|uniref:Threonine/homoserine/homoserine lactone efflux protein n=1 Tax=Yoonia litorea TaxID=1123755 RepID=A0A1I6L5G8_9RHOB|nr:LysE family translocator [Yoonia litorea]SFR98510.1 Threonine/homoserine/homoserine lactone efflux protein [Yoonia litorea]
MPSYELLIAFFLAASVFAYMPGPGMLYAAAQTIARGRRAGWLAAFGIHIGGYAHVAAAAFGLAILFEAVPVLYTVLKIAGAGYLIWLGLHMIFERGTIATTGSVVEAKSSKRAFWESVTVEVLNPKTALFYIAFLPQFTDPSAAYPVWLQLFLLGTVVNVMFSSADVFCVVMADKVTSLLRQSATAGRWIKRCGGSILVGLGVNVAISQR